jgi:hypothetical protein
MKHLSYVFGLFFASTLSLNAQCELFFVSNDNNPFDCTAEIISHTGEHLNTYKIQDQIAIFQPICNTKSSYIYTFYRDSVFIDKVILSRRGNSNNFKITQQKESLIKIEFPK